jgi:hypothetical protein
MMSSDKIGRGEGGVHPDKVVTTITFFMAMALQPRLSPLRPSGGDTPTPIAGENQTYQMYR